MKRLSMIFVIVTTAVLPARPGHACDPILVIDPLLVSLPFQATEAPVGGLWWLVEPLADDLVAVELEHARTGVRTAIPVDALVSRGPRHLALRVPDDATPGDVFRLVTPPFAAVLNVSDAPALDGDIDAPTITGIRTVAGSDIQAEACTFLFSRTERFFTTVTVDLALPDGLSTDEALLDVWLVEPGAAAPDDDDRRALEVFAAIRTGVTSAGGTAFNVRELGSFDVHVRVTDPRTGLSSSTERVLVVNDREPEGRAPGLGGWGCGALPNHAPPSTLALLGLFALMLRKARTAGRPARP